MRSSLRRSVTLLWVYGFGTTVLAACNLSPAERVKRAPIRTDSGHEVLDRARVLGQSIVEPVPCGVIHGVVGYLDAERPIGKFVVHLTIGDHVFSAAANSKGIFEIAVPDSTEPTLRISANRAIVFKDLKLTRFTENAGYRMMVVLSDDEGGAVYTSSGGCVPRVSVPLAGARQWFQASNFGCFVGT